MSVCGHYPDHRNVKGSHLVKSKAIFLVARRPGQHYLNEMNSSHQLRIFLLAQSWPSESVQLIMDILHTLLYTCADTEGEQRVRIPPPPQLKNLKNLGFLSNTGPDPLKTHKASKPVFNVGQSSAI